MDGGANRAIHFNPKEKAPARSQDPDKLRDDTSGKLDVVQGVLRDKCVHGPFLERQILASGSGVSHAPVAECRELGLRLVVVAQRIDCVSVGGLNERYNSNRAAADFYDPVA
jgi:hypothetical protein